ncbi:MAG: TIGR03084 family protein [Actinobacteria bacterium]|nr:TIGR03084 family protein [Actinomycetota bacterium]
MNDLATIASDLLAEQESLDRVVADLSDEQWRTPTASPRWSVADQIGHLTYFDGTATLAIEDPGGFRASIDALMAAGDGIEALTLFRHLSPDELLATWRDHRRRLTAAASTLADGVRVPWYGPSMSGRSFLTARLMECWAHGTDVIDAVQGHRPPTDRLRHVAQIGFITRGWTYANRGEAVPEGAIRVVLEAPSGETWTFGPETAAASVTGTAEQFCQVVTQRRHVDDTDLVVIGGIAADWLAKAQAYAGPPSTGPAPRGRN